MVALKTGIGSMVITESAWARAKSDNAKLRLNVKHQREVIEELLAQLDEAHRTIDHQRERLVDLLAEREEVQERIEAVRTWIAKMEAA